jgi:hypothetical protein
VKLRLHVGSLHAVLFVRPLAMRVSGLKPFAVYVEWRQRVRLKVPRRKNLAVPHERDLPNSEVLRAWQGLTVGDHGCDPNYKPTRTWEQIAQENPNDHCARDRAAQAAPV